MGDFSREAIKKVVKKAVKAAFLPVLTIVGILAIVAVILAGSVYFLIIDDGTYKEDDWSSTPYGASRYTTGLRITTDGKIASQNTIQEIWDKMTKTGSRVDLYLNTPKELLQLMYAELITQLPDLREDTSKIRTLEEWQESFNQLVEEDTEYETVAGNSSSSDNGDSNSFGKFELSDTELKGLANVALAEQGSKAGAAAEASLMANRYDEVGSGYGSIVDYVLKSGWWAKKSTNHYSDSSYASSDIVEAVKDVLVEGNRTLPKYIDEHDFRGDISSATNDGVPIDINDNSAYIQHKTIIKNTMGSTYTFYCFPTEKSDPFGYTSQQKKEEYGDYFYGSTPAAVQDTGYKTNLQGGIIRLTRNLVTGETTIKEGDAELEKLKKDYDTYVDDYRLKKEEEKRLKKLQQLEENNPSSKGVGELLSLENWMKQKGYTKVNDNEWKKDEKTIKSGDEELEKLLKEYETYREDYKVKKQEENEKKRLEQLPENNPTNKETEKKEEEDTDTLLTFEEWVGKKGYTKVNDNQWKRNGQKIYMRYVSPDEFKQYIDNYKKNPSTKTREEAMKVFTIEKGKGTTSSKKVSSLKNFLFIGDSITVGLSSATLNEENKQALEGVTYKAEVGKAADYWLERLDSLPSASDVPGVCVMLGVNNPGNVNSMNNLIDKLAEKYPDVNIYIQKVLPVGKAYTTVNAKDFNTTIDSYNMQVQEHCETNEKVHFIDTSDGYVDDDGYLKAGMSAGDGLHIKPDCYDQLVENILSQATTGTTKKDKDKSKESSDSSKKDDKSNSSSGSLEMSQEALDSDPDFTYAEAWRESNSPYNTPRLWGQCTWFAWGKFYEIYGFSPGFTGGGNQCVDQLVEAHPDKFEKSDTPVDGAVFSGVGANHVGIVLRVDGDNVTIQDGNYNGVSDPWEVAITDWQTNTYSLSQLNSMYNGVVFGNPIGGVASSGSSKNSRAGQQYNIKVATFKEITTSYSTNDPEDPNGSAFGAQTTYEMTTQSINYSNMVQSYTMPFDYLWSLLVITEDRGFVFELLRTIYESDIEITVNDNLNDTTVVTENSYTVTETSKGSGIVRVKYDYIDGQEVFDNPGGMSVSPITKKGEHNYTGNVDATRKNVTYYTKKTVRTLTNTVEAALTRANVWIVDYTKNYTYKEEGPNITEPQVTALEDQSESRNWQQEDIDDIINNARSQAPGSVTSSELLGAGTLSIRRVWSKHRRTQSITTTTHTQGYEEGEKTLREKTAKILIENKKEDSKQEYVEKEGEVLLEDIADDEGKIKTEEEINSEEPEENNNKDEESTEEEGEENKDEDNEEDKDKDGNEEKDENEDEDNDKEKEENKEEDDKNSTEKKPTGSIKTRFITSNTFRYKEKNFVTLLSSYTKARSNTLNVASWLFELIEKNEATKDMLDITKYLLYKVTDSDRWGVTEFDFSIYEPGSFNEMNNGELYGDTIQEQVWFAVIGAGYSEEAAAGVLGNIENESGFNPSIIEGGSGIGFGLVQWSFDRRTKIEAYAASKGASASDVDIQIEFLIAELTPGGGAGGYATYQLGGVSSTAYDGKAYTEDNFKKGTPEEAAMAFMTLWERPSYDPTVNHMEKRKADARKYYEEFKGKKRPTGKKGGNMPTYYQTDYPDVTYGPPEYGFTIATVGCGPTSMAMVATALTGKKITPVDACEWATEHGYCTDKGTSHQYIPDAAAHYGIKCDYLGNDINAAVQALKNGKYIINNQAPGYFTKVGHFMVLESVDSSGKISIKDPNTAIHPDNNSKKFTKEEIAANSKKYWALYN